MAKPVSAERPQYVAFFRHHRSGKVLWARGGHVIELQVGPRSLLRDCSCGRAYLTPPAGVVDPGQCWVCRKLGEVTR